MNLSRRDFLRAAAVTGVAAGAAGAGLRFAAPARAETVYTAGTTLASVATPGQARAGGYRPLVAGPGWPMVVREDLSPAKSTRAGTRTALASLVQLTDLHITDVQSPARFEYVHPIQGPAFRPQEALGTHGTVALINRINALPGGPCTGRDFDAVVTTGDNTDNREHIELTWYLTLLAGGTVVPNSGAPGRFEGLQALGSELYYRPESAAADIYKERGFEQIPGLLQASIRGHHSPGLRVPWYSVLGNHDDQFLGTVPNGLLDAMYTSPVKFDLPATDPTAIAIGNALRHNPSELPGLLSRLRLHGPAIPVTADERRLPFTNAQFVRRHFDPAVLGAGPHGHGFIDPDGPTWYDFPIAPGVTGIALNTCNSLGIADGSISQRQLDWLEARLRVRRDELVLVFSHHTSTTMTAQLPNPETPGEAQYDGRHLARVLTRHPNVIAWVNGHTHDNAITAHRGADHRHHFWEINTASHIDFPQLARIIEVADNLDGTISLFTPLIEADSPYTANPDDLSPTGLASLYRELSANDLHAEDRLGRPTDRNCELLLADPR